MALTFSLVVVLVTLSTLCYVTRVTLAGEPAVLDPGQQAMASTVIDSAAVILDRINAHATAYKSLLEESKGLLANIKTVSAVVSSVGALMSAVSAAAVFTQILFTFLMPSDLSVIQEEFKEVNRKLDAIADKISDVETVLRSSTEFNSWMSTYITWEDTILRGETKLTEYTQQMTVATDDQQKLRVAKEYITWHEANDVGAAIESIHSIMTEDTPSQPRLFKTFITEKGCQVGELTRFFLLVQNLIMSGTKQIASFKYLRTGNYDQSQTLIYSAYNKLYDVRDAYLINVWGCLTGFRALAEEEAKQFLKTGGGQIQTLQERLTEVIPNFRWSVAEMDAEWENYIEEIDCYTGNKPDLIGNGFSLPNIGSDYITVTEGVAEEQKLMIVYEDAENPYGVCNQISRAQTKVYVKVADRSKVAFAPNMMTTDDCGEHVSQLYYSHFNDLCANREPESGEYLYNFLFFAAGLETPRDPCNNNDDLCNNHGKCRNIPSTNQYFCQCRHYYDGATCNEFISPTNDNAIMGSIASLRLSSVEFSRVPDIIDVSYAIIELEERLNQMEENIINNINYAELIAIGDDIWVKITYISTTYRRLRLNEITSDLFYERCSSRDFDFILSSFSQLITGSVFIQGSDFMTSFRKMIASSLGNGHDCMPEYTTLISNMRNQIVILDQIVTEAWMWTMNFNVNELPEDEQAAELAKVEILRTEAEARWRSYTSLWDSTSCPELTASDLEQNCSSQDSYENMGVTLSCLNNKNPVEPDQTTEVAEVQCRRSGSALEWSVQPSCAHTWGGWTAWSTCSKTCGGGTSTRTRNMGDGSTGQESNDCSTQDCCQAMYGTYKCGSGECIDLERACDGEYQCSDQSDEPSDCRFIKMGDKITLESAPKRIAGRKWISGEGTIGTTNYYWLTTVENCPDCIFTIDGESKNTGEQVMRKDKVGFRLKLDTRSSWLSCMSNGKYGGDACKSRSCPGPNVYGDIDSCVAEIFSMYINPFDDFDKKLEDGDIVLMHNHDMDECLNSRDGRADMSNCNEDNTYWIVHKINE